MKKLKQLINSIQRNVDTWKFYGALIAVGGIATWYTYHYAIQFSDFSLFLLFSVIVFGIEDLRDKHIHKNIDHEEEIKAHGEKFQGNIAYGLSLVARAIVLLSVATLIG